MIPLRRHDTRNLLRLQKMLLAADDAANDRAWRRQVMGALRTFLGGDTATFALPAAEELVVAHDLPPAVRRYPAEWAVPAERYALNERAVRLGVITRPALYGNDAPAIQASAYYQELVVPMRAFHPLGFAAWDRQRRPVQMVIHQEARDRPRFGPRELTLMQLLRPAFSGAALVAGIRTPDTELPDRLEVLGIAALLFSSDGRLIHASRAARGALARLTAPERRDVQSAATLLARPHHRMDDGLPPTNARMQLRTRTLVLRAVAAASLGLSSGPARLVLLERQSHTTTTPATLREAFDLTERQATVALLLADHLGAREIAERLSISANTSRRHAEAVFRKMGVTSRSEVSARIQALHQRSADR